MDKMKNDAKHIENLYVKAFENILHDLLGKYNWLYCIHLA